MSYRILLGTGLYLLVLTYSTLTNYFDTDDMMNLYGAWHNFAGQVRPAGALFYRSVFEVAGFNPIAFHAAAYALILCNLALLARLLTHLTPSPAAALFFGCYQGSMWMIYASTGMIYDVLCATFLYAALLIAIERPTWWPVIALLHIGAVSAKELGITLPAILILYSLYHRRVPSITLIATAAISIFYGAQRFLIRGPLTGHVAYTPEFTLTRILENITAYTNILFSHVAHFTPLSAVLFWLGLFALAGALRSRPMAFGLLFFWLAMSPMLLATPPPRRLCLLHAFYRTIHSRRSRLPRHSAKVPYPQGGWLRHPHHRPPLLANQSDIQARRNTRRPQRHPPTCPNQTPAEARGARPAHQQSWSRIRLARRLYPNPYPPRPRPHRRRAPPSSQTHARLRPHPPLRQSNRPPRH